MELNVLEEVSLPRVVTGRIPTHTSVSEDSESWVRHSEMELLSTCEVGKGSPSIAHGGFHSGGDSDWRRKGRNGRRRHLRGFIQQHSGTWVLDLNSFPRAVLFSK